MIGSSRQDGFETPMAMALLIMAAGLLIAASSYLMDDIQSEDDVDTGMMQAESIGKNILKMRELQGPVGDNIIPRGESSTFIWNGNNGSHYGTYSTIDPIIEDILPWAPDGLWCIVHMGSLSDLKIYLEISASTWTHRLPDGTSLSVIIGDGRYSPPEMEVST